MPPGWCCTDGLSPPSLLAAIFYYYYYFFPTLRGLLGSLTCSKTLENWHTPWNLRPLGLGRDRYTGVTQGLYSAPWNTEGHISYILARRHMKLGTHVDLIKPNNFRTACHRLRPTGSWLFRVYYSYFWSKLWGLLGSLTYSKTLENLHTLWNLCPLGACRGWDPGVAQGLYGAPWNTVINVDV